MWHKIALTLIHLLLVYMISLVVREYLRHAEGMSVEISSGLQNVLKNCQLIIYTFQLKSIPIYGTPLQCHRYLVWRESSTFLDSLVCGSAQYINHTYTACKISFNFFN
jgi:uncharacterized radical SAM superfamily Fe-S cluster-containing enzyme